MSKYRRIVPVLLLSDGYLVKPVKFSKNKYIGDPINAVKIFNEMQTDEIIILDTDPSRKNTPINFSLIEEIASEAFMPVSYGGGVKDTSTGLKLSRLGVEKVVLGSSCITTPNLIKELSSEMGSQGVVTCIDYKTGLGGSKVYISGATHKINITPEELALKVTKMGAGEILLQDINREGTLSGYDLRTLEKVKNSVSVPVAVLGGAGNLKDIESAFKAGASAACAGTMFVTRGPHKAVLISYPDSASVDTLRGF